MKHRLSFNGPGPNGTLAYTHFIDNEPKETLHFLTPQDAIAWVAEQNQRIPADEVRDEAV